MTTDAATRRSRAGAWAAVLTVMWVVGVPYLMISGIFSGMAFKGAEQSPESIAEADRYFVAAAIVAVLLPLAVTVIAVYGGRTLMATIYLILTLIALLPVLAITASGGGSPLERVPPTYGPGACQEHSGGDTRCPGG